jgi:glucose-1-phosphate thymidylyltransferase
VHNSVIGPHVSIGTRCQINSCILRDTIVDDGTHLTNLVLEHSLIGRETRITNPPCSLNIGDHAELTS